MRKVLQSLVAKGGILLHGSPHLLQEIHPHYTDEEMAICATPYAEIAIVMAIFKAGSPHGHKGYTATLTKNSCCLIVKMCEKTLKELLGHSLYGYVYTVDAEAFSKTGPPFEFRTYDSIYVQERIPITKNDLPFIPIHGQTEYKIRLDRQLAQAIN